jgi:hypothetical protein
MLPDQRAAARATLASRSARFGLVVPFELIGAASVVLVVASPE